jgi:hypothetical protein
MKLLLGKVLGLLFLLFMILFPEKAEEILDNSDGNS